MSEHIMVPAGLCEHCEHVGVLREFVSLRVPRATCPKCGSNRITRGEVEQKVKLTKEEAMDVCRELNVYHERIVEIRRQIRDTWRKQVITDHWDEPRNARLVGSFTAEVGMAERALSDAITSLEIMFNIDHDEIEEPETEESADG